MELVHTEQDQDGRDLPDSSDIAIAQGSGRELLRCSAQGPSSKVGTDLFFLIFPSPSAGLAPRRAQSM